MDIQFQTAKKGTGRFGAYKSTSKTVDYLKDRVPEGAEVRFIRDGNEGPKRSRFQGFQRLRHWCDTAGPGDLVVFMVEGDEKRRGWTLRAADVKPVVPFPDGVDSIDTIVGAVYEKFNDKYGITNLGICASKVGEHHECNAWDIGVSKPQTADAIHAAILEIANFLRVEMLKAMQGEQGLPVNGVIVMEQICSREDTNWHYYSGVAHVSHVHVSGWPNLVPGWV